MHTKKIIQLYQALETAELTHLLQQYSQGGKDGNPHKEYHFLSYLGSLPELASFSYADAAHAMSSTETNCRQIAKRLSQIIEQLFVHRYTDTHPQQKLQIQLAALDERGCFERIDADLRKHRQPFLFIIETSATISDAILHRYRLAEWQRNLITQDQGGSQTRDDEAYPLIDMFNSIELFTRLEHIRLATALKSSKSQLGKTYADNMPDRDRYAEQLAVFCDSQSDPLRGIFQCYLSAYDITFKENGHDDPAHPHPLWLLLQQHIHQLPTDDRRNLFRIYLNKNIRQYNQHKDSRQTKHLLTVYKWGIDQGLMEEKGWLTPGEFKNYLTLCLHSNHLEEASGFIKKYGSRLPRESRDSYIRFCQGLYSFEREEYGQVLKLFSQKFGHIELELPSILLHAQAEWSRLPLPRDQVKAIRPILRKLKLLAKQANKHEHRQLRLSTRIHYFQQVVRVRGAKEELIRILHEVDTCDQFPGKEWILQAIHELIA